jgi:hypothetical protein
MTYCTVRLGAYRVRCYQSGKATVYHGRKKLGTFRVSVPAHLQMLLPTEDLVQLTAETAIDAAVEGGAR